MRLLGCFVEPNCFVGLAWDYRENLNEDDAWDDLVRECQLAWRDLFPGFAPHKGSDINDYVSSNVEVVNAPKRWPNSRRNV